jgi:hypothetical protein
MTVYTFGCSFTYGCEGSDYNATSWVEKLAQRYPDIEFEDFAYPGTCIEYSLYHYERVAKRLQPEDITVFQFTIPFRYTTWTNSAVFDDPQNRHKKSSNYTKFVPDFNINLERYIGNLRNWQYHDNQELLDKEFHTKYYTKFNEGKEMATYNAIANYLRSKTTFTFFHCEPPAGVDDKDSVVIQNILGKQFKKYTWDWGRHFGDEGCNFVADIVEENIGLKNK